MAARTDRNDRATAVWLALVLFAVYLLTYNGRIYSSDGWSMFAVTDSAAKRADLSTDQMWTLFRSKGDLGPNDEAFAKYGYGTSLFALPFYAAARALPGLGLVQSALLASAAAMALSAALVFLSARRLQFSPRVSGLVALAFGLATPAWVYAIEFWSEPFSLLTLFAAFYLLQCFRTGISQPPGARFRNDLLLPLAAGIALGLAIAVRTTNAALVPFFLLFLVSTRRQDQTDVIPSPTQPRSVSSSPTQLLSVIPSRSAAEARNPESGGGAGIPGLRSGVTVVEKAIPHWAGLGLRDWPSLVLFLGAAGLGLVTVLAYNAVRFGNPLTTGYRADETFSNPVLLGLYGLLFSPGKGLFIYVPFLAVLPWSAARLYRRAPRETLLALGVLGVYLVTFAAWYYWWGGTNWGPRFLVPALPFLLLLTAPAFEYATGGEHKARAFAVVFTALVFFSVVVEVLGVSLSPLTYRLHMLGVSSNPEVDAIFQPALSPLVGYWNLLKPNLIQFAWLRGGQVSAPALAASLLFLIASILGFRNGAAAWSRQGWPWMIAAALVVALFCVYQYRGDDRYGVSAGYRDLLSFLHDASRSTDVLVLNDDAVAPLVLNENKSALKWYGLARDPARADAATLALVARLARESNRLWYAWDDSTANLPDPIRDLVIRDPHIVDQYDFDDGVHLLLLKGPR